MIPIGWDDGFTRNINGRIAVRPMLQAKRVEWGAYTREFGEEMGHKAIFKAPWYFGPQPEKLTNEERIAVVKAVLMYEQEKEDFRILDEELSTHVLQPKRMHNFDCDTCREFVLDDDGMILQGYNGEPQRRNARLPVLCEVATGDSRCPRGHHSNPKVMGTLSSAVWRHYWTCRAIAYQPVCPIIMRNWTLLRWILDGRVAVTNPFPRGADHRRVARDPDNRPVPGPPADRADPHLTKTTNGQCGVLGRAGSASEVYVPYSSAIHADQ